MRSPFQTDNDHTQIRRRTGQSPKLKATAAGACHRRPTKGRKMEERLQLLYPGKGNVCGMDGLISFRRL